MGTHINKATFDQLEAKKVINWMPLSGSETMANPYSDLRYAGGAGYFTEMKTLVQHVSETTGKKKVCAMILPIDFGKEISAGSKAGAEAAGGGQFAYRYVLGIFVRTRAANAKQWHAAEARAIFSTCSRVNTMGCDNS